MKEQNKTIQDLKMEIETIDNSHSVHEAMEHSHLLRSRGVAIWKIVSLNVKVVLKLLWKLRTILNMKEKKHTLKIHVGKLTAFYVSQNTQAEITITIIIFISRGQNSWYNQCPRRDI